MRGVDVPFFTSASTATTFKTNVGIGTPPNYYTLIVDTGSANTWVSARGTHPFKPTEASRETNQEICVRYGTGSFRGKLWVDRVTIGSLVIENQGIGVAEDTFGFEEDVDGILGLGLAELTKDFIVRDSDKEEEEEEDDELEAIPTILDNLFSQGKIQSKTLAISFDRFLETLRSKDYSGKFYGVLTFGGTDPSRYTGEITYVPIPQDKPSRKHWSFEQRITYGYPREGEEGGNDEEAIEILEHGIGVIDTGSSVVHLTPLSFDAYRIATHAHFGYYTGLLCLSPEHPEYSELKSLFFHIGGTSFEVPPENQFWPRELNGVAGGPPEDAYLTYVQLMSDNGVGISLINGHAWLQHFYVILDAESMRIGIAKRASSQLSRDELASRQVDVATFEGIPEKGEACVGWPVLGTLRKYITPLLSPLSTLSFPQFSFPSLDPVRLRLRLPNMSSRSVPERDDN